MRAAQCSIQPVIRPSSLDGFLVSIRPRTSLSSITLLAVEGRPRRYAVMVPRPGPQLRPGAATSLRGPDTRGRRPPARVHPGRSPREKANAEGTGAAGGEEIPDAVSHHD